MARMGLETGCRNVSYACVLLMLWVSLVSGQQLNWVNPPRDVTIPENTRLGSRIFSLKLVNGDGLRITSENNYVTVNETMRGHRSLDVDVLLNVELDYDIGFKQVRCLFKGFDNTNEDIPLPVILILTDVNDRSPVLTNLPYTVIVPENTIVNAVVYTKIAADDPDTNDRMTYTLTTTDADTFTITNGNGQLILAKPLDFEMVRFYQYRVTVADLVGHNTSADVFITVEDVQDTPPSFIGEPLQAKILENATIGTSVIKVEAVDGDKGVPNGVTLSITSETCKGHFQIHPKSGVVSLKTMADRETGDVYNNSGVCVLGILATEDNQHHQVTNSVYTTNTSITITIVDVNDNAPNFKVSSYTLVVDENTQKGVPINFNTPIIVTDPDQGTNAKFDVKVTKLQDFFEVIPSQVQSTGEILIRVKNSTILDYERNTNLSIELAVVDVAGNLTVNTAPVTININNINDNSPVFSNSTYYVSIPENLQSGSFVINITATDADVNDGNNNYGTVTYTLQGADTYFIIENCSGHITVGSGKLDRETRDTYSLTVVAEDGGHIKASARLEIKILDVNDQVPTFVTEYYQTSLKEGDIGFLHPVTVLARDNDEPNNPNSQIGYFIDSILPMGLNSHFRLNSTTGTLSLLSAFDYEKIIFLPGEEGQINLTIIAKDEGKTALSSTVSVIVILQDINNNAPSCNKTLYTMTVPENSSISTAILQVNAVDDDGTAPNNVFMYSIDQDNSGKFNINSTSGWLSIRDSLDREEKSLYNITVTVTDFGTPTLSGSCQVVVTVSDINDSPPVFLKKEMSIYQDENTNVSFFFTATDADLRYDLVYNIQWSVSSGQNGQGTSLSTSELMNWITIDKKTSEVKTLQALDRETISEFVFQVVVEDIMAEEHSPQLGTATITVKVNDANDEAPKFTEGSFYNTSIRENMPDGSDIKFVNPKLLEVYDADDKGNNNFRVQLLTYRNVFEVRPQIGTSRQTFSISVLNTSALDYEVTENFTLEILAEDVNNPSMNSTASIFVEVINENDNVPEFIGGPYQASVLENSTNLTHVISITATDRDHGSYGKLTYSMYDNSKTFAIDSISGEVFTIAPLDREMKEIYTVSVRANDIGNFASTTQLIITVEDVNDNYPQFTRKLTTQYIPESQLIFSPLLFVSATDIDAHGMNSQIKYSLLSVEPQNLIQNFSINSDTSEITLNSLLDYESLNQSLNGVIVLHIKAEDQGIHKLSNTTIVTVTLKDVNDVNPQFNQSTYTTSIPESFQTGETVFHVTAVDGDVTKSYNEVSYMIDTLSGSTFYINDSSGAITLIKDLDYEMDKSYTITVTAMDHGNPVLTSTAVVEVTVTDVNDCKPVFDEKQKYISQKENTYASDTNIATDKDLSNNLVYSIQWNMTSGVDGQGTNVNISELMKWITIDKKSGEVMFKSLDREAVAEFVLQIIVEDIAAIENLPQRDTATLTVKVIDENDEPPVFTEGNYYKATIRENMPVGSDIQFEHLNTLVVSDADEKGDNSNFDFHLLTHNTTFSLSQTSGNSRQTFTISVLNSSALDYEKIENFTLEVLAMDPNNPNMNDTATIFVEILNENDNIPEFIGGPYQAYLPENSTHLTKITILNATDKDHGIYGELTYSLDGSPELFGINNITGEVFSLTDSLDRENISQYTVTAIVKDKGNFKATTQLTIFITDINDNCPKFTRNIYYLLFDEESNLLLPTFGVKALDEDDPNSANSKIEYSLLDPSLEPQSHFTVDLTSGMFTLTTPLDCEKMDPALNGTFFLKVLARDKGTPQHSSTTIIEVTVKDINDNAPQFENNNYTVTVYEDASLNTFVVNVNAMDIDVSPSNNKVTYILDTFSANTFNIDPDTGNITIKTQLDREQTPKYSIIVTAMDNGHPITTSTILVNVTVGDVNDSPPVFAWHFWSETVMENSVQFIVQNTATDQDLNPDLCYSILWSESSGTDGNQRSISEDSLMMLIAIDASNGTVYSINELDREKMQRLQLTLLVEDKNNQPGTRRNDTASLTVMIEDLNDNFPTFERDTFTATIQENMPADSEIKMANVSSLIISDADSAENSMYNITLEDMSVFTILPSHGDGNTSCVIKVVNPTLLDYEKCQNITIKVIATEYKTLKNSSSTITVYIQNINDNFPKFNNSMFEAYIPENSQFGAHITTLQAIDADLGEFGKVQYFIDGPETRFVIDNNTGEVTLNTSNIDRETKDSYTITVIARDTGKFEGSTQLTIRIADVNDEIPKFQLKSYAAEIMEKDIFFKVPLTVKATDNDDPNTDNSKIFYLITEIPQSLKPSPFVINNISGELNLLSPAPDYENLMLQFSSGMFQIEVTAIDLGFPPQNSSVIVNITVTDFNDETPVFKQSHYLGNVFENSQEGVSIAMVIATDGDGTDPNNQIYYAIQSGSRDKLQINSSSGIISVGVGANLDRESTEKEGFNLTVIAIDKGSPALTGTTTVSITVLDVNDTPPKITPTNVVFAVNESAAVGSEIAKFNATDDDENSNLTFRVLWLDSHAYDEKERYANVLLIQEWLDINNVNGIITVKSMMDREEVEQMILKVVVADLNAATKNQEATATVTVSLLDVNDNPPVISNSESGNLLHLNVSEGTKIDTEVTTLTASDADKGETVIFSLANTNSFQITASGKLILKKILDRETDPVLNFTVIATDSGSPALSSNISVIILVLDINDKDPEFVGQKTIFNVFENSDNKTFIGKMTATDEDAGDNGNVTFLFKDNSPFRIDPITGNICVSEEINREVTSNYTLTVIATDNPLMESRRRASLVITIVVDDLNDNAPQFPSNAALNGYTGIISEAETQGFPVSITPYPISATDADIGNNRLITFSLELNDTASDFFSIDPQSGEVSAKTALRGYSGTYSYLVNATDKGIPALWTVVNLTINILERNMNSPVFVDIGPIHQIPECAEHGRSVYKFSATDADKDKTTNGKVQYYLATKEITGTNHSELFDLDSTTGVLSTTLRQDILVLFDSEKDSELVIQIIANDSGMPEPKSTLSDKIHIQIADINDNPPEFGSFSTANFSVKEGRSGIKVGHVKAFDKDKNSQLTYVLSDIDDPWKDHFYITDDPVEGGVIYINKSLDRELADHVKMKLTATDISATHQETMCGIHQNFAASSTAPLDVIVIVEDINDSPPVFKMKILPVGFLASTKFGEKIINLQNYVTDNDTAPNSVHTFYQVGDLQPDEAISKTWTVKVKPDPIRVDINGTVSTNYKFSEDAYGYFHLHILVNDSAGFDNVDMKVYVVGDSQVIHMTLLYTEDELRQIQNEVTKDLSQIGVQFVPDNILPAYADDGSVDHLRSVLVTHAVDANGNIIDGKILLSQLEGSSLAPDIRYRFKISKAQVGSEIDKQAEDKSPERIKYILIGVIALIAITFVITLYLLIHNIQRFKRKLKAATVDVHNPMPNVKQDTFPGLDNENIKSANPIFMRDDLILDDSKFVDGIDQNNKFDGDSLSNISENSLDQNAIHSANTRERLYPTIDEQEVTINMYGNDELETSTSNLYSHFHFRHSQLIQQQGETFHENKTVSIDTDSNGDQDEALNLSISNFESTEI